MQNSSLMPINEFANFLAESGKSAHTIVAYKKDIEQISTINVKKDILEFSEDDLKHGLEYLRNKYSFSNKTLSRKINSLRTFFNYFISKKAIAFNPAASIIHPKLVQKKQRILKDDEIVKLIQSGKSNKRLYTMLELLLNTGIRISELSNLKIKDIDLSVEPAKMHVRDENSKIIRTIDLNDKIKLIVAFYIQTEGSKNNEYLFETRNNKNVQIRNIRSSIDRIILDAKIKNACVNDIRNTFIVKQLEKGYPIEDLARYVGHVNTVSTQKYLKLLKNKYTQIIPNKIAEV